MRNDARRAAGLICFLTGTFAVVTSARADEDDLAPSSDPPYETVVTSTPPLHGSGLPVDRVPSNVQTSTGDGIAASRSLDLSEYMSGALGSVSVNQTQNNPLQPDLQYRGFLASPLLGAPQGLAVYMNGVRLNEPFGDTVNWDLIPANAIRSTNLMPGSNPLFGLNTLGGALSIETKSGFSQTGAEAHIAAGSFGRRTLGFEMGNHGEHLAYFVAGSLFKEDGWRPASGSQAMQVFMASTYRGAASTVELTLGGADTVLNGNGPAPAQLLAMDRAAVFTLPDRTENQLFMATLRGERTLAPETHLSGLVYYRGSRTATSNGDQGQWRQCQDPARPNSLCRPADGGGEAPVVDPAGAEVPFDAVHPYDAADNSTRTRQNGFGAAIQAALEAPLRGHENHLFFGATGDQGRARFTAQTALARLSATRATLPTDIVDAGSLVAVDATTSNLGLYVSDTFAIHRDLFLTLSARYNLSALSLADQIGDALSGEHEFQRLNPAAGISYQPIPELGAFAGYSESARAPTPIELTCASPDAPCRLPNSFVSDPALDQVVARTFELGVRGRVRRERTKLEYSAAAFRTANAHDILFISSGAVANQGYFANVGDTRRQGIEASLWGRRTIGSAGSRIEWSLRYTLLDATFETAFSAPSANHPLATDGAIAVPAGARLPGIPRHIGKGTLTWVYAGRLAVAASAVANSGQYLRGDEANLLAPLPGFVVVDLRAAYEVAAPLSVFVKVSNVFDARYATFGVLGNATGVLGPGFDSPRFESPGAPRAAWAGIDLRY
jgi:outer membrane receptor protein involved in Fe transport